MPNIDTTKTTLSMPYPKIMYRVDHYIEILENGEEVEKLSDNGKYPDWVLEALKIIDTSSVGDDPLNTTLSSGHTIQESNMDDIRAVVAVMYQEEFKMPGFIYGLIEDGLFLSILVRFRELISEKNIYSIGKATRYYIDSKKEYAKVIKGEDEVFAQYEERDIMLYFLHADYTHYRCNGFGFREWFVDVANRLGFEVDQQFFIKMNRIYKEINIKEEEKRKHDRRRN